MKFHEKEERETNKNDNLKIDPPMYVGFGCKILSHKPSVCFPRKQREKIN